jgi:thiamine-phosphate pyrophosphorylase
MKLVVITQSEKSDNEITAITQMFEAGLETLHVRKNRFSTRELDEYISQIPAHFHNRIIIHSHHKLALKYNLKGYHYTSTHLHNPLKLWINKKLIFIRRPNLIKTISFKRIADVYLKQKVQTSYCFVGTVFNSITGELASGFYPEILKAANQKSGRKIYARGGVNTKSVELAYELGFYGVALFGSLWKSSNPYTKYLEFVRFCKEKNIPIE